MLLLNVANEVMLPIPMLPIVNLLRHPHWELKIETGNTCTMATFYNAPTLRPIKIKTSHKSLYNATKFHTILEVSPRKFHQRRKSFNKNCSTTKTSNAGQIMQKITLNSQLVSTHIFHNVFRTFTTSGIVSRDTAPTVPR